MAKIQTTIANQPIGKFPLAATGPEIVNTVLTANSGVMAHTLTPPDRIVVDHKQVANSANMEQTSTSLYLSPITTMGYLFVTLSHGEDEWRFSNEMLDGGEFLWDQRLLSLPSIQFQSKERGGYVTVNWGSLQFLPDSFTSGIDPETFLPIVIPPPDELIVKAEWGLNDRYRTLVFEGEAYLRGVSETSLDYDLYEEEFKNHALGEGIGPEGSFDILAMTNLGADEIQIQTHAAHGYEVGEEVVLQKTNNLSTFAFNDDYYINTVGTGVDVDKFTITIAGFTSYNYANDTERAECGSDIIAVPLVLGNIEHALLPETVGIDAFTKKFYRPAFVNLTGADVEEGLNLFDDGVDVNSNFASDTSASFRYLEPSTNPIGKLSASGKASNTTLGELFIWAAAKMTHNGLELELNTDKATVSTALNCVITEQMLLIDLLDKLAGYCNHSFYILGGTLYLSDNDIATSNLGIFEEGDIFSMSLGYEMPTRMHQAKWQVNEAGNMRLNSTPDPDPANTAPTLKTVKRDVFIKGSSPLGDVRDYKVYDQKRQDVRPKIKVLKAERDKVNFQAEIPLEGLPPIGCELTYLDEDGTNTRVLVRSLTYNFEEYSISIKGKVTPLV